MEYHVKYGLKGRGPFGMLRYTSPGSERMARWRDRAAVLVLTFGLLACSGQNQAEELAKAEEAKRKALSAKKSELDAYLVSGTKVSERLDAFRMMLQAAQTSCREDCNIEEHREEFKQKVLPSFDELLMALEAMPTQSKELKGIHDKLVKAYRKSGAMLADYPKDLTFDNKNKRLLAYIQDLSVSISDVEKAYNEELKAYCSDEPSVDCSSSTAE
tara:strand:- start:84 stop:728 length:645 start_codon:yes stop_codon:yes gene_type:complete